MKCCTLDYNVVGHSFFTATLHQLVNCIMLRHHTHLHVCEMLKNSLVDKEREKNEIQSYFLENIIIRRR